MDHRLYPYVGPREIAKRVASAPRGEIIASVQDLRAWLERNGGSKVDHLIATFVIDSAGQLRLADRHSEHVACAGGEPVLAAGEMTLSLEDGQVRIEAVSNQSTGYCPEPSSWPAVARALTEAGLDSPARYDPALEYRRCPACSSINIVKDSVFECTVCGEELPPSWNLSP